MGHRANMVLVENAEYQLFFCHWCGKTIPKDVFWGLKYTLSYILDQRPVSRDTGWLDDIWSEGGLLLDTNQKVLLLYGGEDLQYDIPYRRLYLELLRENWLGWEIRWAHEGIFDMADYVKLDRKKVLAKHIDDERANNLNPPQKREYTGIVGSVRLENGQLRLYALSGDLDWYLCRGPALVDLAQANPGEETLPLHEWVNEFPQDGFHIDVAKRQLAIWSAYEQEIVELVRPFWDGWELLWLKDNFEYQVEQTDGRLTFPTTPTSELLNHLEQSLLSEYTSGLTSLLQIVKQKEDAGHQVQVNPSALLDDPQQVEFAEKRLILERAIAAWKQKKLLN